MSPVLIKRRLFETELLQWLVRWYRTIYPKGFERGLFRSGDDVDLAEMYPGLIVESILAALPGATDLAANEENIEVDQLSW